MDGQRLQRDYHRKADPGRQLRARRTNGNKQSRLVSTMYEPWGAILTSPYEGLVNLRNPSHRSDSRRMIRKNRASSSAFRSASALKGAVNYKARSTAMSNVDGCNEKPMSRLPPRILSLSPSVCGFCPRLITSHF